MLVTLVILDVVELLLSARAVRPKATRNVRRSIMFVVRGILLEGKQVEMQVESGVPSQVIYLHC